MDEITVTVPARSEYVPVLRSVIAGVAARLDLTLDGIDDLRLAIDEAASHLISLQPAGTTLVLRMLPSPEAMEVISTIDAAPEVWPPADVDDTLTWQILSGLADEAGFERTDGNASIRFVKRIAS